MAVYKIPQDVEADDKFVGPLSFKQFIFAGIAAIATYLTFLSLTKGFWPALILFTPIIIVTGFLAFPWGRDQPTEIWLAARIRFFLKPRVRIWNQSGIKDLVTVTAPKHVDKHYTDGLSQNEVSSRLSGLADLLDSRGWAVKNVNVNAYRNPLSVIAPESEDRLVDLTVLPEEVVDVTPADDVLDETVSPTAQHFEAMIKDSEEKHRQGIMDQLKAARSEPAQEMDAMNQPIAPGAHDQSADFWFLQQGGHKKQRTDAESILAAPDRPTELGYATFQTPNIVAPNMESPPMIPGAVEAPMAAQVSPQDEEKLLNKIHKDHEHPSSQYSHLKTIMPLGQEPPVAPAMQTPVPQADFPYYADEPQGSGPGLQAAAWQPPATPTQPVTPPVNPAILNLAKNDDLNVATIARQASKQNEQRLSDDEVVISLH